VRYRAMASAQAILTGLRKLGNINGLRRQSCEVLRLPCGHK